MNIAVIGGDGTGPEVAAEGVKVLKAVAKLEGFDKDLKLTDLDWGGDRYLKTGEAYAFIDQAPFQQALDGTVRLYNYLVTGEAPAEKVIAVEGNILTPDDVK